MYLPSTCELQDCYIHGIVVLLSSTKKSSHFPRCTGWSEHTVYLHLSLPPGPFSQPVLHLFRKGIFGATNTEQSYFFSFCYPITFCFFTSKLSCVFWGYELGLFLEVTWYTRIWCLKNDTVFHLSVPSEN